MFALGPDGLVHYTIYFLLDGFRPKYWWFATEAERDAAYTTISTPTPTITITGAINWLGEFGTDPVGPAVNDAYYNTVDFVSYIWNGSTWEILAKGARIVWLGDLASAPGSPNLNEAYYNTTTLISYIWDGSVWQTLAKDGAAGGGSDLSYTHAQPLASATWNVTHSLGKYPSVTILNTSKDEVIGDVNHIDTNNLTITFVSALGGNAYMN